MIKNKRREGGVVVKEAHVCGGRCVGEGGFEADEVCRLSGWGGVDGGCEESVVAEDGVHDDLEVGDGRWGGGEEDLEGGSIVGEDGFSRIGEVRSFFLFGGAGMDNKRGVTP
jgi:hypothetical protein